MAFQTFKTSRPAMSLEEFGCDVARRREALGNAFVMPRNSGKRRTKSKQALLSAIETSGGKW